VTVESRETFLPRVRRETESRRKLVERVAESNKKKKRERRAREEKRSPLSPIAEYTTILFVFSQTRAITTGTRFVRDAYVYAFVSVNARFIRQTAWETIQRLAR